jgi:hypothetical protein
MTEYISCSAFKREVEMRKEFRYEPKATIVPMLPNKAKNIITVFLDMIVFEFFEPAPNGKRYLRVGGRGLSLRGV